MKMVDDTSKNVSFLLLGIEIHFDGLYAYVYDA